MRGVGTARFRASHECDGGSARASPSRYAGPMKLAGGGRGCPSGVLTGGNSRFSAEGAYGAVPLFGGSFQKRRYASGGWGAPRLNRELDPNRQPDSYQPSE